MDAYKRGLKKGGAKEQQLSATAVGLLAITLGAEDAEELYKELAPTLTEIIANTPNEVVKSAAMEALAILVFIAPVDEPVTISALDIFSAVFDKSQTPSEQASAMKAWSLLVTTLSTKFVHSILLPQHLSTFVTYLQNEDVRVRVSAGECIALLFEIAREEEEEEFNIYDIGEYASIDIDELLDTLYSLSQDKTKQRAKKDKFAQRVPFKEITNTVESGLAPKETLEFKFQKFEFDSWMKITQLSALRDMLGIGLKAHFEHNDLLQDIFDIVMDKEATKTTYSQTEKRLLFSPSSPFAKSKTKNLNRLRTTRTQLIHEGLDTESS